MSLTPSTMLSLGTACPDFSLPNAANGETVSLADFRERGALLVMFVCNHCPYVVHVREAFRPLYEDYAELGLGIVAINSNSERTHPEDGPEHMRELAHELGWEFPYLFDATQDVARAFSAACTPDFFIFDGDRRLVYRGQLDGSRPGGDVPVTGDDLRAAVEAVLDGRPVSDEQRPSIGCNIKWDPDE